MNWSPPPHVALFIRNLKLLQLDQYKDWPEINSRTLSPSPQNQRQRIKAVEWALYHLFAIWDPEGTQNKLRPFFPPLEPLQSVNLRAALFRGLSELKKNGDLGRETILRKTMLDDCKGDKFDEVLAVFSTAVIRKVLDATEEWASNPALRLSTSRGVTLEEHQMMVPLILAHQVSLSAMGERRARVRSTHDQFSQLLDKKKAELASRKANKSSPFIPDEPTNYGLISREVKENWLGSEEWADTLLYGGARSSTDGFLELPFPKAWTHANESTVEGLSNAPIQDLLIDLESRVSHQRSRLHRWHEFSDSIQKRDGPPRQAQVNVVKDSPLVFRDHQSLTVASVSKIVRNQAGHVDMTDEDKVLLASIREALAKIDRKPLSSDNAEPPIRSTKLASGTVEHSDPLLSHTELDKGGPISPADTNIGHTTLTGDTGLSQHTNSEEYRERRSPIVRITSEYPTDPEPNVDDFDSEPTLPEPDPRPYKFSLVERTRKSMSLVPPHSSRVRENHLSRRARQSFPVNQFETPRKEDSPHHSGASTPKDDLFSENADYASVFKSRPRIAQSPISSPAVHVSPLDEFDLDDNGSPWGANQDRYEQQDYQGSPSASRRRVW